MNRTETLRRRLRDGPALLLDGAVGTELECRGVDTRGPLWSAVAIDREPALLRAIHAAYVAAGAEILTANTFRTNPRALHRDGIADRGPELCCAALDLAREAAAEAPHPVWVAASVAPVEDCYEPNRVPDDDALAAEHGLMAEWLAAGGVDLIWIETMNTAREARAAAAAARAAGLPFAVHLITRESGDLLDGSPLADAVTTLVPLDPLAIGVNCIPPSAIRPIVERLRSESAIPISVYGHISNAHPLPHWSRMEEQTPAAYADLACAWVAAGARVVGGCCGTRPDHIAAIRARLRPEQRI